MFQLSMLCMSVLCVVHKNVDGSVLVQVNPERVLKLYPGSLSFYVWTSLLGAKHGHYPGQWFL